MRGVLDCNRRVYRCQVETGWYARHKHITIDLCIQKVSVALYASMGRVPERSGWYDIDWDEGHIEVVGQIISFVTYLPFEWVRRALNRDTVVAVWWRGGLVGREGKLIEWEAVKVVFPPYICRASIHANKCLKGCLSNARRASHLNLRYLKNWAQWQRSLPINIWDADGGCETCNRTSDSACCHTWLT